MRDNQGVAWEERSRESSPPPPSPPVFAPKSQNMRAYKVKTNQNSCCVHEQDDNWMLVNGLKLNKDKTELLVISD